MSDWVTLAALGGKAAKETGLFANWRRWLRRKKKILVLGASGAGKTQLVHSLINPLAAKLDDTQRTIDLEHRRVNLSDYPFLMIDTPGQVLDEAKRKRAIASAVGSGVEGIINVVCFGYHEAAEAGSDQALPSGGSGIADATYLRTRRRVEIDLLSEWVPFLDPKMTRWVLTVVTKADLWWPQVKTVTQYYETGTYATAIGDPTVSVSVLPHCAVIEPFHGYKTSGRFGDHQRAKLHAHLKESLIRLTGAVR